MSALVGKCTPGEGTEVKFRMLVASGVVLAIVVLAATAVFKGQKVSYEGEMVRALSRKS